LERGRRQAIGSIYGVTSVLTMLDANEEKSVEGREYEG
jgi:hypothetical protein